MRTALGVATISFYAILFLGGAADVLSTTFGLSVNAVLWTFRFALFLLPPAVAWATYRLCKELSARDGLPVADKVHWRDIPGRLRHGVEPRRRAGCGPGPGRPRRSRHRHRRTGPVVSGDDVFPDRDMSPRDKIEFMLEQEGWAMEAVRARADLDPPMPTYSYTVGFEDRYDFPEVCVFGPQAGGLPRAVRHGRRRVPAGGTESRRPRLHRPARRRPAQRLPPRRRRGAGGMFPSIAEHHTLAGRAPDGFRLVESAWPDPAGALPGKNPTSLP